MSEVKPSYKLILIDLTSMRKKEKRNGFKLMKFLPSLVLRSMKKEKEKEKNSLNSTFFPVSCIRIYIFEYISNYLNIYLVNIFKYIVFEFIHKILFSYNK